MTRLSLSPRAASALTPLLATLCFGAVFAACLLGSTPLSPATVMQALLGQSDANTVTVIWSIRLPRAIAALLVGFSLGICGAALQGLLRNPLAEPGVLGVSASATLMATLAIYYKFVTVSFWALPLAAIGGALASTALLAFAALRTQSSVSLILIGFGLSSFAGAFMSLLLNLAPTPFSLADMINWSLGSVANRSFSDIALVLPFMLLGWLLLFLRRADYSVLSLGEEGASAVGLALGRLRIITVLGTGLSVGAAVALAGAIGFIGLVAPHIVRPLVGNDPGQSLLPSGFLAALMLLLADIGVRLLPTATELNLGVAAAVLGAPVFVWLVLRREQNHG